MSTMQAARVDYTGAAASENEPFRGARSAHLKDGADPGPHKARAIAGMRRYNPELEQFQVLLSRGDIVTLRGGTVGQHAQRGQRKARITVDRTGVELDFWTRMLMPL